MSEILNFVGEWIAGVLPDTLSSKNEGDDGEAVTEQDNTKQRLRQSIWQGLQASATILAAVVPLALFTIFLLYVDLNTTNICYERRHRSNWNGTVVNSVMKLKLAGEDVQDLILNLWFPELLALLFGYEQFTVHCVPAVHVGVLAGIAVAYYKAHCHAVLGIFGTEQFHRWPGNVIFIGAIIVSSVFISRARAEMSKCPPYKTFILLTSSSFVGFCSSMVYKQILVPEYNKTEDEVMKILIAVTVPLFNILVLSLYMSFVLKFADGANIEPRRAFVLLYFIPAINVTLYRVAQAECESLWLFTLFSLLHGCHKVGAKARIWTKVSKRLHRAEKEVVFRYDCPNLKLNRELRIGLEIQAMLFEYTAVIMSPAYRYLYFTTSYQVPESVASASLRTTLIRIIINLAIVFMFNCICNVIEVHCNRIPIHERWTQSWKHHMMANSISITAIASYYPPMLVSILQVDMKHFGEKYEITDCPFA